MPLNAPPGCFPSRRAFLVLAAGSCSIAQSVAGRGDALPSEARRYSDAATELTVVRLTDPTHTSLLTSPQNRGMGRRNFLLFSNDRTGKFDVYRMDLRGGQWRQLTDASSLDPATVALLPGDRGFCFIDGGSLREVEITARLREREVYSAAGPFERLGGLAVAPSGAGVYVVEERPGRSRIRLVPLGHGPVENVIESDEPVTALIPRSGGGLAYRCRDGVWFIQASGKRRLTLAPGRMESMYWSQDGTSLLYLNIPGQPGELNAIREHVLASGEDRLIAKTTQFVHFYPNGDASVFVGASGSKASPHVLILLRSTRRELTLCEHRAQDPASLAVLFSPNSQRIVFQSDQHGKPALYTLSVERFVAETES